MAMGKMFSFSSGPTFSVDKMSLVFSPNASKGAFFIFFVR